MDNNKMENSNIESGGDATEEDKKATAATTDAVAEQSEKSSSNMNKMMARRVTVLSLGLNLVNYLDRAVIGAAAGPIISDFKLSNAQFGWLTSGFAFGCLFSNLCGGFILDRVGVKYMWTIAIVGWSSMMLAQAFVPNYPIFVFVRILMGIFEGVNFLAMDRAHADYWIVDEDTIEEDGNNNENNENDDNNNSSNVARHRHHRSFHLSLSLLGVFLAFVIGYPIFSNTVPKYGWRATFIGLAILGFVAAVLFLVVYREQDSSKKSTSKNILVWEETKMLLRDKSLLAVCWSFGTFGYVLTMSYVWLPNYLKQAHSISLEAVGVLAMAPFGLASVLVVAIAIGSDWLYHYKEKSNKANNILRMSQIYPIAVCQFLSAIAFVPLIVLGANPTAATVCTVLGIGFGLANNAPYYTFCAMRFPHSAAQATGVMVSCFTIGSILSPIVTGYIMDGSSSDEDNSFGAAFGVVVGLSFSAVIGLLVLCFPDTEKVVLNTTDKRIPAQNDDSNENESLTMEA